MSEQFPTINIQYLSVLATLISGLISAAATIFAVYFTNKWTSARYEKDKIYQNKKEKFVIIKPSLRFSSFPSIIDELITYNVRERILVLSSEKEGFEFFDEDKRFYYENHKIIGLKNNSTNAIHSINIDMQTKLITDSQAIIEDKYSNFVKQLRPNEEILLRIHNTEQRTKLWEELNNNKRVKSWFKCTVNYFTDADEQICYEYEAEIQSTPNKKEIEGRWEIIDEAKTNIIKDEYKVIVATIHQEQVASVFRNIQDYITLDRANYIHQKIGAAQARGLISQFGLPFGNQNSQSNIQDHEIKST